MRRNTAQSIRYSGLVLFLLCNIAVTLWLLSLFQHNHFLSTTKPPSKPPSSNQWSAGSAFFTLTAANFGFYAQPPGSLLFSKSGRVWRLSPLYALADTVTVFWIGLYVLGRLHRQFEHWPSFRTVAVSILVMRIANERDALGGTSEVKKYQVRKARGVVTDRDDISIPQLFEEVDRYDSGPSFRAFVWGPMLLQLLKLIIVRGSPLSRSLGVIFFCAWLVNDVLLIIASSGPLSAMEKKQAVFIVDDGNPQALQLRPGSYLKRFRNAVLYAQSAISIYLIAIFTTGGWYNIIALQHDDSTIFSQFGQVCSALSVAFWCYCMLLMAMDCTSQIYKSGGVDESRKLLVEGAAAYTALVDWVLRLLCFLAVAPLEKFHDVEKTFQPSWYEWLG